MDLQNSKKSSSNKSEKSNGLTKRDVSFTTENEKMEDQFRNTSTKIREGKLNKTIIPEVSPSGLDYTMINLTTIEDIDEELMYKPLINVSVIGRLDNLKV